MFVKNKKKIKKKRWKEVKNEKNELWLILSLFKDTFSTAQGI
jgi:hypothetical protein